MNTQSRGLSLLLEKIQMLSKDQRDQLMEIIDTLQKKPE